MVKWGFTNLWFMQTEWSSRLWDFSFYNLTPDFNASSIQECESPR